MKRAVLLMILAAFAVGVLSSTQASAGADKITICHATGAGKYVTLVLPPKAVYGSKERSGHFNENGTPAAGHEDDYLGPCLPPPTPPTTTTTPPTTTRPSTTTTSTTTTSTVVTTSSSSSIPTSTTSPTTTGPTTTRPATSTTVPRSTSTSTSIVIDTCDVLGTCPSSTTTTLPDDDCITLVCRGTTTVVTSLPDCTDDDPVLVNCEPTTTTAPPSSTLAYGGSDAAEMFLPWAALLTCLGGLAALLARRPV